MAEIPFDRVIWNAEDCARYLGVSKTHFLQAIRHAQGFPKPLPIPPYPVGGKVRTMDPRWSAVAVTGWALGETAQDLHKTASIA